MTNQEWPAENYAIGSYIQSKLAEPYLPELILKPSDRVLDIGCGDGTFTTKILEKIPQGHILGIDSSSNMIKLARKYEDVYPNFSAQVGDVMTMTFDEEFDSIVSFWCLQWSKNIVHAFLNMYHALKKNGNCFVLCPSGEPGPYYKAYCIVKAAKIFPELETFSFPPGYKNFDNLPEKLATLPYSHLSCERIAAGLTLPSLDIFKRYVAGIVHFHDHFSPTKIEKINAAMVEAFDQYCKEKYQGEYRFEISIYKIRGMK